jgi:flagellar hook-associated protein 1
MSNSIYGLGISGLTAAQAGLVTTGHNITNAGTAGYHRQSIEQSALPPVATGSGYFGQGVQVDTVVRAYNRFLEAQLGEASALAGYYSAFHTQLAQVDNVVADTQAGVSPALQEFFAAVQAVATNPADIPSRQSMVSAGAALASRFNSLAARFDALRSGVNTQLTSSIEEVNAYAQQIAALNHRILALQQIPGQPPNDVLDQRDALVTKLNQLIGANVVEQGNGTVNIFIGNGQGLVIGHQSMVLATAPSLDDPQRLAVAISVGGGSVLLNESGLQSGALGGLLAFRAELDTAQNALGRVALGLVQSINDQHRLGQDLYGALGESVFSVPAPAVFAKSTNTSGAVIAAAVANVSALTTSDYRLSYDGVNYAVTRLADNTTTTYAALPQTVDGLTLSVASGVVASGESFLIEATRGAARDLAMRISDPAKIAAAAPMRTAATGANRGSGAISAGTVNAPPPPDPNLQAPVTLTFTSAGTFDVVGAGTGNPTSVAYVAGSSITYNGWTVQISGSPAAGDVFTITPNSGGVADGRNALLLAGLQTRRVLAAGTATLQGAYSQMVSTVGNRTHQLDVTAQTQVKLVEQATQAQQAFSGVNLDEEAGNLLRYQQAYQASGKMIQIAASLFQTLLELGG